jgi:hypothetical protein
MPDADPNYTPGTGFAAVADEIVRRASEIRGVIKPVAADFDDTGELDERGLRESRTALAAEMLLTALVFVAKAGQEGYHEDLDAYLAATEDDIGSAVRCIREIRASHAKTLAETGRESPSAGVIPVEPGRFSLSGATIRLAGGEGPGDEVLIEIGDDGRARWSSRRHGKLPVNMLTQIDLSSLVRDLDNVYARGTDGG